MPSSWLTLGLLAGAGAMMLYGRWSESSYLTPLIELQQGAGYRTLCRRMRYRGSRKAKAAKRRLRAARDVVACAEGSRKKYQFRIGHEYVIEKAEMTIARAQLLHLDRLFDLWKYIALLFTWEQEIFGFILPPPFAWSKP